MNLSLASLYGRMYVTHVYDLEPLCRYYVPLEDRELVGIMVGRGHAAELGGGFYQLTDAGLYWWTKKNYHIYANSQTSWVRERSYQILNGGIGV